MAKNKLDKSTVLNSLKRKKWDLFFNFIAMLIAGIIGIVIGFQLQEWRNQKLINHVTTTKLHNMYSKLEYNVIVGKDMYEHYSDTKSKTIFIKKLDDFAAKAVLRDGHILNRLSPYKISLLQSYIDTIDTINTTNEQYINYLRAVDYKITSDNINFRETIKIQTENFLALCCMLRLEFKDIVPKKDYDRERIGNIAKEIKKLQEKNFPR